MKTRTKVIAVIAALFVAAGIQQAASASGAGHSSRPSGGTGTTSP